MSWQILTLLSVIFGALTSVLTKRFFNENKISPVTFAIFFQLFVGLAYFVWSLFIGIEFPANFKSIILFLAISITLYALGNIFKFKSLGQIEASEYAVISQLTPVVSFLMALFFLGEDFAFKNLGGLLLIIAGVAIVTVRDFKFKFKKGEIYAMLYSVCFGLAFAIDAFLITKFKLPVYLAIVFIAPALATLAYSRKSPSVALHELQYTKVKTFLVICGLYFLAALFLYQAYKVGNNLSQIAPLAHTVTLVTVGLSYVILAEKGNVWRSLLGAFLGFAGVLLIL